MGASSNISSRAQTKNTSELRGKASSRSCRAPADPADLAVREPAFLSAPLFVLGEDGFRLPVEGHHVEAWNTRIFDDLALAAECRRGIAGWRDEVVSGQSPLGPLAMAQAAQQVQSMT